MLLGLLASNSTMAGSRWHPLRNLQHVLALAASALAGTASLVSAAFRRRKGSTYLRNCCVVVVTLIFALLFITKGQRAKTWCLVLSLILYDLLGAS